MMTALFDQTKRRFKSRGQRDGYILVEVLATMTISALVLVGLVSVMSLVTRASQRAGADSQKIEDTSRIVAALTREVQDILPMRWSGENGGFVFQGTDHGIVFARRVSLADGTADPRVVLLQGSGKQLIRREVPLLPGYQGFNYLPADGQPALLESRYSVRFAYFARSAEGQETLVQAWTDTSQLPVAVRVSLVDDRGSIAASTRIPLRVDAEPGCAAPGQGVCGMFAIAATDDAGPANNKPVDADDNLGWLRYGK